MKSKLFFIFGFILFSINIFYSQDLLAIKNEYSDWYNIYLFGPFLIQVDNKLKNNYYEIIKENEALNEGINKLIEIISHNKDIIIIQIDLNNIKIGLLTKSSNEFVIHGLNAKKSEIIQIACFIDKIREINNYAMLSVKEVKDFNSKEVKTKDIIKEYNNRLKEITSNFLLSDNIKMDYITEFYNYIDNNVEQLNTIKEEDSNLYNEIDTFKKNNKFLKKYDNDSNTIFKKIESKKIELDRSIIKEAEINTKYLEKVQLPNRFEIPESPE